MLIAVWTGWWSTVASFYFQSISSLLLSIEHNFGENFSTLKIYLKEIFSFIARRIHYVIINLSGKRRKNSILWDLLFQETFASKDICALITQALWHQNFGFSVGLMLPLAIKCYTLIIEMHLNGSSIKTLWAVSISTTECI